MRSERNKPHITWERKIAREWSSRKCVFVGWKKNTPTFAVQ